jgi:hypothetical protein
MDELYFISAIKTVVEAEKLSIDAHVSIENRLNELALLVTKPFCLDANGAEIHNHDVLRTASGMTYRVEKVGFKSVFLTGLDCTGGEWVQDTRIQKWGLELFGKVDTDHDCHASAEDGCAGCEKNIKNKKSKARK